MKKAIIAVLATATFFLVGTFATYFAIPKFSPDMAERAQWRADSIRMMKDGTFPDSLLNPEDYDMIDTSLLARPLNTMLVGLRDSLSQLHSSLGNEMESKEALMEKVKSMESRWEALQAKYDEAKLMSGTLAKLEDNELSALLESLETDVIESLYIEASARNRTRLLQMMPADKAASLVNTLTAPGVAFSATAATAAPAPGLPNQ
ncbi:MAG: hypothetical protein AAF564_12145 [Bacteroidota bacterium]